MRGLRITIYEVLSGNTQDFPDLTEKDILACLAFAANRERKVDLFAVC